MVYAVLKQIYNAISKKVNLYVKEVTTCEDIRTAVFTIQEIKLAQSFFA